MNASEISDPEKLAIAAFMDSGGGVFATGDHDGLGSFMCGYLPRVRTMRKWFHRHFPPTAFPGNDQTFIPNWIGLGDPERNDTTQKDAVDQEYYFHGQSDGVPQPLKRKDGSALASGPVHTILRDRNGLVIDKFPDHMHEGEATDFASISESGYNPN